MNGPPVVAGYRQQEQRERDKSERVSAQGTRGCPFPQGELYLESSSENYLVINPTNPQVALHVTSPNTESFQQTVKVSLVDSETLETKFLQEYLVKGASQILIAPDFVVSRPHILSAGLICNPQRPSTTKSLRILLVPDEKN
ncbi:hypothetical protein [Crocosphaera sp. XPORK-15E]|uniref:hypothetical protein n=1 Tax=Crocosphaera sp. XPORK-15E TaxID=3110247 RepID=UPI002B1F1778|nr:hypothetical protein [Crocosphaera sp. XPORK-15E]